MEKKGANVGRKSEKRKPTRARREKIRNYRKWPRRPYRNSMNCVTYRNVIRTSPGGAYAHMRTHDGEIEVPGPVGAYTTTHNDTITLMPNLIHRISFTERKFECRTRVAEGTSAGRSTLRHNRTHAPTGPRRARTYMRI